MRIFSAIIPPVVILKIPDGLWLPSRPLLIAPTEPDQILIFQTASSAMIWLTDA
jgi:hypothetical protein